MSKIFIILILAFLSSILIFFSMPTLFISDAHEQAIDDIFMPLLEAFGSQGNNGYEYYTTDSYKLFSWNSTDVNITHVADDLTESICIPSAILNIWFDGRYIIATQSEPVSYSILNKHEDGPVPANPINYWIVDTESDQSFGPLTIDEYKDMLDELSISNTKLEPVLEFVNRNNTNIDPNDFNKFFTVEHRL